MLKTIPLLLLIIFTPTLLDRSDYQNWQQGVARYITEEVIPNHGYVEGSLTLATGHHPIIGLVDNNECIYYSFEDDSGWSFVSGWREVAEVTHEHGLAIFDNGTILYQQNEPYPDYAATVRVVRKNGYLYWYLNDELMFVHWNDLTGRDLRGYYYDDIAEPLIGVPRGAF